MGHLRQEIALGLVSLVRSLLGQLKHLGLVGLLLLLHLQSLHLAGIDLLVPIAKIIEQGDEYEYDDADQYVHHELLPDLCVQLPVANGDDHIPLVQQ